MTAVFIGDPIGRRGDYWLCAVLTCVALPAQMVWAGNTITGTATYRERIALPPDAIFEAVLDDVSKADAPAEELGRVRFDSPGNPPIRFQISYEPARVKASHRYSVRVRITRGARLLFTTDQAYPVLTHGQGSEVTLQLRRVGGGRQTAESMSRSLLGELPASFVGDLPCADCPGIRFRLDLFPDQSFFLRMTYLDRGPEAIIHEIGSWATSSDGQILVLHGSRGATELFAVTDANTLRKLNTQGQQFESALNYDLARTESVQPIEPRLTVRGLYRYGADAGQFIECLTRRRLPVAQEGDNAAMEAAYLNARRQPEEDLLVTLEGRIAMHPRMEGDGLQPTLVVERFLGVWPGETCGARFGVAALEDTYWKLTRLGGRPVIVGERQREPHLILRSEIHRVSGSAGCNRLVGEYHVEGRRLSFEKMATTRMACAEGLETEEKFLAALEQVKTWKIVGENLELYDAHGAFLARFETRHLP